MRVAIIGAGSTGRGHLAEKLYECGQTEFVFIDKNSELVDRLRKTGEYTVRLLGSGERLITIGGYEMIDRAEAAKATRALLEAELILTAVLAENLLDVADLIATAVEMRMQKGIDAPWDIICCENYDRASTYLKGMVCEKLSEGARDYLDRLIGFPDCMISRVVPIARETPEKLVAEDYNEWVVRASDVKGDWDFACIEKVDNLEARLERKLWIHNGGHAAIAYSGFLRGHQYIHEAVKDPICAALCVGAMTEAGEAILHKYPGFDRAEVLGYVENFAARGAIEEMRDDIRRVVRDPIRKLGIHDRLTAPALYAAEHGLQYGQLAQAIANITRYEVADDSQSVVMQRAIREKGIERFLREDIGIEHGALVEAICRSREMPI